MASPDYSRMRRETCYEIIARRKFEIGRCECGNCNHRVTIDNHHHFDFDHIEPWLKPRVNGRRVGIAELAKRGQIKKVKEELPKCRLLLVTCHRDWSRHQRKLGFHFPPLQGEWTLHSQPWDLPEIQRQVEDEEGEKYVHFGISTSRREGDWVVSRDHNLQLLSCYNISTGKWYGWHPTVGFYEDTGPESLVRAMKHTH